jgi:hypothetical protein
VNNSDQLPGPSAEEDFARSAICVGPAVGVPRGPSVLGRNARFSCTLSVTDAVKGNVGLQRTARTHQVEKVLLEGYGVHGARLAVLMERRRANKGENSNAEKCVAREVLRSAQHENCEQSVYKEEKRR